MRFVRRSLVPLLPGLFLVLPPSVAPAQTPFRTYMAQKAGQPSQSDTTPDLQMAAGPQAIGGGAWDFLKERSMGVVKGCNYMEYINLANRVRSGWEAYRQWDSWKQARDWAVPFLDLLSMLYRAGGVMAAKKSAEYEGEGLIYQLEQLCNVAAQAYEINRQHQILEAGRLNIGNALDWLVDATDDLFKTPPGSARDRVLAQWAMLYDDAIPSLSTQQDSLWKLLSGTLRETLQASDDLHQALEKVQQDINVLRDSLFLRADYKDNKWTCPEGYPDPNRPDVQYYKGSRLCGLVSPERSQQLLAHIELLKTQLKAIELAAQARGLEVDAVRLMADNHQRRMRHTIDAMNGMSSQ